MRLGLISERVSLHAWFPCKAESEKRQLFQSKWSNAFQIQIGIDPRWGVEGRRAGGGEMAGDGQTTKVKEGVFCICLYPLWKKPIYFDSQYWGVERMEDSMPQEPLPNTDKQPPPAPCNPRTVITWGERDSVCVLEEEMLILVLILKGPDRSIALSSLWKSEINMFLKTKQAACGVCVWASLIPPDV